MTAVLAPPPQAPAGPRPLLWTCAEFHRLGDAGAFAGRRAKLLRGVIVEEGPMNPPHALTIEVATDALRAALGAGWRLRCQLPLVLGQDLDPMPDLAAIAGSPRDLAGHPTTVALVVEIADSSLAFDTGEKRLVYARAAIADYWVIDLNARQLLVYRDPRDGDYATQRTFGPADAVAPLASPGAAVRVADLLA